MWNGNAARVEFLRHRLEILQAAMLDGITRDQCAIERVSPNGGIQSLKNAMRLNARDEPRMRGCAPAEPGCAAPALWPPIIGMRQSWAWKQPQPKARRPIDWRWIKK